MLGHALIALDFRSLGFHPALFTLPAFHVAGLTIGPLSLRWYSLAYIGGILGGWWLLTRMLRSWAPPMTLAQAEAFITWATLGIILGGRIGYILFYDFRRFAAHPVDVVKLWEGGMSFHGGVIGSLVAIFFFARRHGLNWLRIADYVACVEPIGQCLGRLANFVNGELWGRVTGTDWGIVFPDAGRAPRYPSQLFEAAGEGLLLFAVMSVLFWRTRARVHPGLLTGAAAAGFGAIRFAIEFFREPDAQVGYLAFGLTMGQLLCLPMIVGGAGLIVWSRRRTVAAAA
ncbi:MAG: prolipoprotein diacylglyceryl transferase [Sphingomonadaceae bacterium]|nr:prolipoprotein diacylglyceryl transferase [Sphingomonadaceae bacterium]